MMKEIPTVGTTHLVDHRAALPTDIITAWFNGEYLIGDKNTNLVNHLGFCLALLGTYRYFTIEEFEESGSTIFRLAHYGFCRIELIDQELEFHGMRVYTNPNVWGGENARHKLPLWKSDFSKIWDDGASQNLLFAYSLKHLSSDSKFFTEMNASGLDSLRANVKLVGENKVEADNLSNMIEDLKDISCPDNVLRAAETRLSTPEWNTAWLEDYEDSNSNNDGDLFAFLRFRKLGEALLSNKRHVELISEYRTLAPSKLAGFNCFLPE